MVSFAAVPACIVLLETALSTEGVQASKLTEAE